MVTRTEERPAEPASPISCVEAEVLRIRALLQAERHQDALAAAQALVLQVPENRDVLYMIAVSHRLLRQFGAALATLDRLESSHPGYSRLFQERGHCRAEAGDPEAAIAAFLHAVHLNPALPASWRALALLFRSAGNMEDAEVALSHVKKLKTLAPAVVTASSMFADGETHAAEQMIRDYLKTSPRDVEGMRLLARIGIEIDVLDDAEFLLESVLTFAPNYQPARYDYVQVLLKRHRNVKALEEAQILLRAEPANRDYRAVYATSCLALADYGEAIKTYRELLKEAPQAADLHLSIGHALKTLGRQQEAVQSYRSAAEVRPSFGDSYWSLANLKIYRFTDDEISRMQTQEADAGINLENRYHICFALGKALEDREDFAQSFAYYDRGNTLKKREINYRPETTERNTQLQKSIVTQGLLAAHHGAGCQRPGPIFIIGLPRAGSTLLEQILASHSQVEGTMELADISRLALRLQGRNHTESAPQYPAVLETMPPERLRAFGEKYLADTQIYRTGKPFFIDKNPNNFRHLGLIHLILPNAKIIDARREPMACCFSNFKQLFAAGQEFTYSLQDVARYYRSYVELMSHWDNILPGKILRVQHEDIVEDLGGNVRRILDFCGLSFEPQCLDFHKTDRSVRTASSEQVRRPIFNDGLHQWKNFEPWLAPLRLALTEPVGTAPFANLLMARKTSC